MKNQPKQPGFFRGIIRVTSPTEMITFIFIVLMLALTAIFQDHLDTIGIVINSSILLSAIVIVNFIRTKSDSKFVRGLHTFYIIPVVLLVFKTVEKLSFSIHGRDYDNILMAIDRGFFGANPTVWLYEHIPVMPLFVEIMQICYFSYYFLPIILAVELFIRRRHDHTEDRYTDELEQLRFIMIYGLLTSYLGYFSMPGIGPRFTIHDFWGITKELPGIYFTEPIRWFINLAENIRVGMTNAQAAHVVTRDVFPSGHTELALLSMILAFRFNARARWVILFLGTGLIFSTVYLRYHYVIDVLGGTLLALITLWSAPPLMRYFMGLKRKIGRYLGKA
ncbi:MAG: phosphatase PAP2 family protein [Bacteroidota bacterium]|nr:phosphatase PAP2 family protein [Bacteroidota bacterium]